MPRRILVVDDERAMVKTLADILRQRGWEVHGAHSGTEAVAAIERDPFDAVLMDIKMPGLDGVAAFKAMKARRPGIRVVLMTAYTAHDLIAEAEREGALRVVPKPVDLATVLPLLEERLRHSRSVLVVDSEPAFLKTLAESLRAHGYDAVAAASLDTAIDRLEEAAPAVVLLHLRLDHIAPEDSVVAIKQLSPAVTLILYSGDRSALATTKTALPSDWVYAYLEKPFAVERLTGLLDELVGR
jgi:DNA-binding NtrC family response regulator